MVLNGFRNLTDQEIKKKISDWWSDLEYFKKLKILLLAYPDLDGICKIEGQGVSKLWESLDLQRQEDFYQDSWKY